MAIEIFVKDVLDNEEYRIQVLPSDTFLQVKEKINDVTNIAIDDQVLKLNGLEVTDDYTIEFYEIENGMTIELIKLNQPTPYNIRHRRITPLSPPTDYVPDENLYIQIDAVAGYTTVAQLKAKVHQTTSFPLHRIKFFFRGRELTDDLTVSNEFVDEDEPIEMKLVTDNDDDGDDDQNEDLDEDD